MSGGLKMFFFVFRLVGLMSKPGPSLSMHPFAYGSKTILVYSVDSLWLKACVTLKLYAFSNPSKFSLHSQTPSFINCIGVSFGLLNSLSLYLSKSTFLARGAKRRNTNWFPSKVVPRLCGLEDSHLSIDFGLFSSITRKRIISLPLRFLL